MLRLSHLFAFFFSMDEQDFLDLITIIFESQWIPISEVFYFLTGVQPKLDENFQIIQSMRTSESGKGDINLVKINNHEFVEKHRNLIEKNIQQQIENEFLLLSYFPTHKNIVLPKYLCFQTVSKERYELRSICLEKWDCDLATWLRLHYYTFDKCVFICKEILTGLEHLHSYSVLHHDICMKNILVRNDEIGIFDFGVSVIVGPKKRNDFPGRGDCYNFDMWVSTTIDIYAIGVLMERLFLKCAIPDRLESLIKKCKSKNQFERPTCSEILKEMENITLSKRIKI
jgi:serine/threonine protein kinase